MMTTPVQVEIVRPPETGAARAVDLIAPFVGLFFRAWLLTVAASLLDHPIGYWKAFTLAWAVPVLLTGAGTPFVPDYLHWTRKGKA